MFLLEPFRCFSKLLFSLLISKKTKLLEKELKEKSYLVSSSYDTSIIFWKTVSNINQINQLNGHLRQTERVIKLTNSNYLVSASDDFTLKVWDQFINIKIIYTK